MNIYQTHMMGLYVEPHRYYHDARHILDLFSLLHTGEARGINLGITPAMYVAKGLRECIKDAIWAHDCVYEIGRAKGWNETSSFQVWMENVECFGTPEQKHRDHKRMVSTMVMATIDHEMPEALDLNHVQREAVALFLDLDMAALAVSEEQWVENTEALREEFTYGDAISDEEFDIGRRRFLTDTLSSEAIYHSNLLAPILEPKARRNIEWELSKW